MKSAPFKTRDVAEVIRGFLATIVLLVTMLGLPAAVMAVGDVTIHHGIESRGFNSAPWEFCQSEGSTAFFTAEVRFIDADGDGQIPDNDIHWVVNFGGSTIYEKTLNENMIAFEVPLDQAQRAELTVTVSSDAPEDQGSDTDKVDIVDVTFDSLESPICAATADHEAGTSLAEASITPSGRKLKWELMDNDIGVSWKTSDGNTTQEAVITESNTIVAVAGSESGPVTARVCDSVLTSCTATTKQLAIGVTIGQEAPLLWSGYDVDGTTRLDPHPQFGPSTKLTAIGASQGTFIWTIKSGNDLAELSTGEDSDNFSSSVSETDDNCVLLRAKDGSVDENDKVIVELKTDGNVVDTRDMVVHEPAECRLISIEHNKHPDGHGYETIVTYRLITQTGYSLSNYPVGEVFPQGGWQNDQTNTWPSGKIGGGPTRPGGYFPDGIGVVEGPLTYPPIYEPPNEDEGLGDNLVRHITQEIRAGKGVGVNGDVEFGILLRTNIIREYTDHASIVTKGNEHDGR